MSVSLKNIATELNISTAAASRALNDRPGVSDELRLKVKEVAFRLGYGSVQASHPPRCADQAKTIAVLFGHVGGSILQAVLRGMDEVIRLNGYRELRVIYDPARELYSEEERVKVIGHLVGERDIAGIIACYIKFSDVHIAQIYQRGIPLVLLENITEYGRCVTINQIRASAKAVSRFVETGRRQIALVLPTEEGGTVWKDRQDGYRQALRDKKLPYSPELIVYADWLDVLPGAEATRRLLQKAPQVDAILYGSDTLAAGGMQALRALNRKIPEDIAIIGFDDDPMSASLSPALSTVRQPFEKMAAAGLGLLMDSMNKGDYSHRAITLETELILRETDAVQRTAKRN